MHKKISTKHHVAETAEAEEQVSSVELAGLELTVVELTDSLRGKRLDAVYDHVSALLVQLREEGAKIAQVHALTRLTDQALMQLVAEGPNVDYTVLTRPEPSLEDDPAANRYREWQQEQNQVVDQLQAAVADLQQEIISQIGPRAPAESALTLKGKLLAVGRAISQTEQVHGQRLKAERARARVTLHARKILHSHLQRFANQCRQEGPPVPAAQKPTDQPPRQEPEPTLAPSQKRKPKMPPAEQLQWDFLPPGKRLHSEISKLVRTQVPNSDNPQQVDYDRLKKICSLKPNACYVGKVEWEGYAVFTFDHTPKAVLECLHEGNALYIIEADWRKHVRQSKGELMMNPHVATRVTHRGDWLRRVRKKLGRRK